MLIFQYSLFLKTKKLRHSIVTLNQVIRASARKTIRIFETFLKIFQKDKKGCVLVYKNKKMVGILSNRDLVLRTTGPKLDLKKIKVEEVMTRDPGFLHPDDPIAFAINKMAMGGYRHIPILRPDGTPVSILLIRDVLRYLSASKKNY